MPEITRGEARQLHMVSTKTGYAIINDFSEVVLELSIAAGKPILYDTY
jgi:hypothetical protein